MRNYVKINDLIKIDNIGVFDNYASEDSFIEAKASLERFHSENPLAGISNQSLSSEQNKYKLHITLTNTDYIKHQRELINILIKYIQLGFIDEFKCTDQARVERERKRASDDGDERRASRCTRFFSGDQFTIYIPDGTDKRQILSMCQEINTYLNKENAVGGEHIANSAAINNYLNFKQQVFETLQEARFNSMPDKNMAIRNFLKENSIYKFLVRHLAPQVHPSITTPVEMDEREGDRIYQLLKQTESNYSQYTRANCRFSMFHIHGETGRIRAKVFSNLASRQTSNQNFLIVRHIMQGDGNLNDNSYRTLLLKNILFPEGRSSTPAGEVVLIFNQLLRKIKNYDPKNPHTLSCMKMLIHLALMGAPHDLIMLIANGIIRGDIIAPLAIQYACEAKYPFITSDLLSVLIKGAGSLVNFEQLKGLTKTHITIIDIAGITIKQALNFNQQELTELNREVEELGRHDGTRLFDSYLQNFKDRCFVYGEAKTNIEAPSTTYKPS